MIAADSAIAAAFCGLITESRMCCQLSQAAAASEGAASSLPEMFLVTSPPDVEMPADAAAANAALAMAVASSERGSGTAATDSELRSEFIPEVSPSEIDSVATCSTADCNAPDSMTED